MGVGKVLELVGVSDKNWDTAVENAVKEASKTVDNITGVEVCNMTADVDGDEIVKYKANVKLIFAVDRDKKGKTK